MAQQPPTVRVAGTVESFDGHVLAIKSAKLGEVKVNLTDNVAVFGVSKATIADVKPGAYIGVGAMPQPDGSQRAIQVTVLAESQRGLSEGHRPWDARPNSTMTNGAVDQTVESVDGRVMMVKYKGGEQKIVVPPDAIILAYSVGDKSELKPGAHIAIVARGEEAGRLAGSRPRQCRARRCGAAVGSAGAPRRRVRRAGRGDVEIGGELGHLAHQPQQAVAAAQRCAPRAGPRPGGAPRRRA